MTPNHGYFPHVPPVMNWTFLLMDFERCLALPSESCVLLFSFRIVHLSSQGHTQAGSSAVSMPSFFRSLPHAVVWACMVPAV